ncbi:hypothetical protein B0J15DRAFT_47915 [Fusarium solani]|uniref:Uncharacterized protein n=1 Tax=Fusarium solani TaxID=169388 RepID=A0A9P9H3W6_FUSSL|nr:uncharacterized protein B0J15DRAFT_47915 [Fusarium solani]KAH7250705.1 hypothetical protein B0J15DRAFT_47915 [Fusarium solani]
MRNWGCRSCVALLLAALWATSVEAADYRRHDGVHRIEKKAQITAPAVLNRRDKEQCGAGEKLCASSLDGGCCPEGYDCAKESCFAVTKGPVTCQGTRVGWYQCEAVFGAGCCPDGYVCSTGGNCFPPAGVAYTYGCPASQYLCPSSLSYGCCNSGMACGVNQCYSTKPVTITNTIVITTTEDGSETTYKTTGITVSTPTMPTELPTVRDGSDENQAVLKFFPSAIPKSSPTLTADNDDKGGGGLPTTTLVGIVAGSIGFLIIVLVAAYIIIRHLNKVVRAVSTSKVSEPSNRSTARPPVKEFKSTDSQVDEWSANPLIAPPPRPANPGPDPGTPSPYNLASPDPSSNNPTPGAEGYHAVSGSAGNSRHTSFDAMGNREDYFNAAAVGQQRFSQVSASTRNRSSTDTHAYTHVRQWSNASENSDGTPGVMPNSPPMELEAIPWIPELPSSPSSVAFPPLDERRRSSSSTVSAPARPPVTQRLSGGQRVRSESLGQSNLSIVNEEMHGFHGPNDHFVGQTDTHRPGTGESGGRARSQSNTQQPDTQHSSAQQSNTQQP